MTSFSILILIAHYSLVGVLCLFGLHRLSMVFRWFGARHYKPDVQKYFKKLPKIKGVKEIFYPGQNKFKRYTTNLKKGIAIPKNILEDIKKLNVIK